MRNAASRVIKPGLLTNAGAVCHQSRLLIEENVAPQSEVFDRKRLCPLLDVVPTTAQYRPRDVLGSDSRSTLLTAWNCYRRHLFPLLLPGHVASKLELPSL